MYVLWDKKLRSDWNFGSTFGSFKSDAPACHQHAVLTNCEGLFNKFSIRFEQSEIHTYSQKETSTLQCHGFKCYRIEYHGSECHENGGHIVLSEQISYSQFG